jgi:hypothetical protein
VDVLHHHLEPIKASSLSYLNLSGEPLGKVFQYNPIAGSEKGKYMLDEMLLTLVEFFPVFLVLSEVDLLSSPKGRLLILVHLPDIMILNREQHEPIGVLLKQGLRQRSLSLGVLRVLLRHDRDDLRLQSLEWLRSCELELLACLRKSHLRFHKLLACMLGVQCRSVLGKNSSDFLLMIHLSL